MSKYELFHSLHQQNKPLLIGNVWNAKSAQVFEKNGYQAIATSSAAVARSLGYEDGENIPFEELFFVVKRILAVVNIPLSVDLEKGYSDTIDGVLANIDKLYEAGVVGINFEDAAPGDKDLVPVDVYTAKLTRIREHLDKNKMNLFVNARTDAYLLNLPSPLELTLERVKAYEAAGANGIFVAFVTDETAIKKITSSTSLPVNVVCFPGLPSFERLQQLGVRRISMGSRSFGATYARLEEMLKSIDKEGSFSSFLG